MPRQIINIGTVANDGTGDNLRQAGIKFNANFEELYTILGGDGASSSVSFSGTDIAFEGATENDFETLLSPVNPTSDNTVYIPDASGTIILDSDTQTLTNKTLVSAELTTPKISAGAYVYNIAPGTLGANRTMTLPNLTSADVFTANNATQTLTNKTLTAPTITNLKISGYVADTNGLELIKFNESASAVNEISVSNAATSGAPIIEATGDDTNIDLEISSKGSGSVKVNKFSLESEIIDAENSLSDLSKNIIILNGSTAFELAIVDGQNAGEIRYFIGQGASTVTLDFTATTHVGSTTTIATGETLTMVWSGSAWYEL